jgi:hypothetical protein
MRSGQSLATVTTPAPVTIKRNQETIHVRCKKEGFEESLIVMNSRYESASAGNFLLGGVIGVIVDQSSGAASKYDPYVIVRMAPLSPADAAAAAAQPKPSPPAEIPRPEVAATAPVVPPPPPTVYGPGAWKARGALMSEQSGGNCAKDSGSYSFDFTDNVLTVDNVNGRMVRAPVGADGSVDQSFKSPTGASLRVVGNVRTRDLEVTNIRSGCRWKLTPL